jgi:copper(I)-binding protein
MKSRILFAAAALAVSAVSAFAHGDAVEVENAWVRATVKGQMGTGAFMTITAKDNLKLVSGSTPVAGVTQVHEMKMDAGVMKMAEVKGGLDLPAGKAVELKPGGYHIMLMDLKQALEKDSTVPITLVFKDAKGVESKLELKLPVAASGGANKAPAAGSAMHSAAGAAAPVKP